MGRAKLLTHDFEPPRSPFPDLRAWKHTNVKRVFKT
jgi:hypothetical protein